MFTVLICTNCSAQVGVKSFYFSSNDSTLVDYSEEQLLGLIEKQVEFNLQIIELNSFSNSKSSYAENKRMCEVRILDFIRRLQLEAEEITIANYGSRRIPVNFKVTDWNRIDIYYTFLPKGNSLVYSIPDSELVIIEPQEDSIPSEIIKEDPDLNQIERNIPINTPIQFKGDKTKIDEKSYAYIDHLHHTMNKHPQLTAHIRGHVCCGNNKRVSKKRAKRVYKRLIYLGVDKERLSFYGYSNTLPLVFPERKEADRKINRRVDIIFN